jgi:chemotaxis protein histidine kinase CheA
MGGMDDFLKELVKTFEGEAAELLKSASQCLMELETSADSAARGALYTKLGRDLHTLKGSGATCGLIDVGDLAHRLEDVLAPLKAAAAPMPPEIADLLLKGFDVLRARVHAHAKGEGGKLLNLAQAIPDLFGRPQQDLEAPVPAPAPAAAPVEEMGDDLELAETSWRVDEAQVLGLLREVERLREHQLGLRDRKRELANLKAALRQGVLQEALTQVLLLEGAMGHDAENAATVVELLEEKLRAIHSVPVGRALEPLQRSVRDACRVTGKQVRLALVGAEVAVDKRLLEALRGPLLHLVRNAVDHGIEAPDLRDAKGKHREGVITLRVEQQGNLLVLEVADDGEGLDPERLREAALRKNLFSAETLKGMDEKRLLDLVFESGFSSKEGVSQLSGRGVGLDVVKAQVRNLRGTVELESRRGQGARFILTLPLELGASPLMIARVSGQILGLPVSAVESVVAVAKAQLSSAGKARLMHREQWLDVVDLGALLGLRPSMAPEAGQCLLVLQSHGRRLGLLVDSVDGDAELVILPLPPELGLGPKPPYAGASLYLGAELVLVLRPDWAFTAAAAAPALNVNTRRALVVDDSLTARAMHRAALESGGFVVMAAPSGAAGLALAAKNPIDVVVCDIQMDGMDGFEFTRAFKATEGGRRTPVILVSVSENAEDRVAGLAAGAEGFLNKRDCAAGRLLQAVAGLMERV